VVRHDLSGVDNRSTILANSLCRHSLKAMSALLASRAVIFLASAHGGRAFYEESISAYGVVTPMCTEPQKRPVRIAFSSTSTVAASDIRKAFAKTCPNLRLTSDPLRSDCAFEAMAGTINPVFPTEVTRYRFTLFNRAGNAFYSTSPHKFSNAINNVCQSTVKAKGATLK
jgi:hypothetical protein